LDNKERAYIYRIAELCEMYIELKRQKRNNIERMRNVTVTFCKLCILNYMS